MRATSVKFSPEQVSHLRKLGLFENQIKRVNEVLPLCRAVLSSAPPIAEVRDELASLIGALEAVGHRTAAMLTSAERSRAAIEAEARVQVAAYDLSQSDPHGQVRASDDEIADALNAIRPVLSSARRALVALPEFSRRHRKASPIPVQLINSALLLGWGSVYHPVRDSDAPLEDFSLAPPYPFSPSVSQSKPFRAIVGVCYDAFSDSESMDPERAIKAFLREERAIRERMRAEMMSESGHEAGV